MKYLFLGMAIKELTNSYSKHKICFLKKFTRGKMPTVSVRLDVQKLGSSENFSEIGTELPEALLSSLCVIFQQTATAADMGDLCV